MKRIAFIPIDNRPVCYTLPVQISEINSNIELLIPDRKHLGDLKNRANIQAILDWFESLEDIDFAVISLDTIAYGGLVSSRRGTETFDEVAIRIEKLKQLLLKKKCKVFAFSSVMRISNNNINEEEKEYWSNYGTKIFEYSFNEHKKEATSDVEAGEKCEAILAKIPEEIIHDYLLTRKRNFYINKFYLKWSREGLFDTLVFSKDDCAQYGLNVKEAGLLAIEAKEEKLNVLVKTGADEIPLSLLSRVITQDKEVKIAPVFMQSDSVDKISKYEDVSVLESVTSQLELAGVTVSEVDEADLVLHINNFKIQQGELVMDVFEEGYNGEINLSDKPYFISDILNANGADNSFVETFFKKPIDFNKFYGYAAWNTTGNTLGSSICAALMRFVSDKYNDEAFKKLQMVRFLDDWAYQANVRKVVKQLETGLDTDILKEKMLPYEGILNEKIDLDLENISYDYPWHRYFEIEVELNPLFIVK